MSRGVQRLEYVIGVIDGSGAAAMAVLQANPQTATGQVNPQNHTQIRLSDTSTYASSGGGGIININNNNNNRGVIVVVEEVVAIVNSHGHSCYISHTIRYRQYRSHRQLYFRIITIILSTNQQHLCKIQRQQCKFSLFETSFS